MVGVMAASEVDLACLGIVWKVSGRYLEDTEGIRKVSGRYLEVSKFKMCKCQSLQMCKHTMCKYSRVQKNFLSKFLDLSMQVESMHVHC